MKDENLPLAVIEDKTIRDLLQDTNPNFLNLLKEILRLHRVRAIELCTFLLNFSISVNYFEGFRNLIREVPALLSNMEDPYGINDYLDGSERIYTIILFYSLKYNTINKLSVKETDQKIDDLNRYGPLVNRFFIFNTILPENYDLTFKELFKKLEGYERIKSLIPDLSFDPEYKSVTESEALKQMYDTSFISDFMDSKPPNRLKYVPDKKLIEAYRRASRTKKIFDIDYNLTISKFVIETLNLSGIQFFSSNALINDAINSFLEYFIKRIPSRSREIKENLACFSELLKFVKGRLYIKVRKKKIEDMLKKSTSSYSCEWFFKRFSISPKDNKVGDSFNPQKFLKSYNRFISYCLYDISGVLYTGVLLIWRALIKYLELIQLTDEFASKKGALLEEWCYERAIIQGLNAAKIILRNPKLTPSDYYREMKKQTKDFPRTIEVEAKFPESSNSDFKEIDLAIRLEDAIYLFECKAKRSVRGAQVRILQDIEKIGNNLRSLNRKGMLIKENSRVNYFKEDFLKGIKHYEVFQIGTGDIFRGYNVITPQGFEYLLQQLHNYRE